MGCNVNTNFNRTPAGEDRSAHSTQSKVGEDSNEKQTRTPNANGAQSERLFENSREAKTLRPSGSCASASIQCGPVLAGGRTRLG